MQTEKDIRHVVSFFLFFFFLFFFLDLLGSDCATWYINMKKRETLQY